MALFIIEDNVHAFEVRLADLLLKYRMYETG